MSLTKANQTSFKTNWQGEKKCSRCNNMFVANSGSQKTCSDCRKCKECLSQLKYSHKQFCNSSCSGKWNQKNNSNVRTIYINRNSPNRGIGISKYRTGKARPDIRGENNYMWSGGTYGTERHRLMGQVEYKNWRKNVFERDNYTCQHCNQRGGKLEADHIVPYSIDKSKALDINNGRTLCQSCHRKTDTWGYKAKQFKRFKCHKA